MLCRFAPLLVCFLLTPASLFGADKQPASGKQADRLIAAAAKGDQNTVDALLDAGVAVDQTHRSGVTALHAARVNGRIAMAKHLIERGADAARQPPAWQTIVEKRIQSMLPESSPGVVILVARNGEIEYQAGFGFASLSDDVPAARQTKFRIGSVTKQFTASAILKLQEEGKLSVSDTLAKYFPDFPRGDEVRLHHLLTHTSGIHSYTSKPNFIRDVGSRITADALIASFQDDPYDFDPGTAWSYNNSGYFLLGEIVAKVSGKSLGEYLTDTFFTRLNMHDTGMHDGRKILKHEALGYSWEENQLVKALNWNMSRAGGAGALYSTVGDLQRWNQALFGGQVLSADSLKKAFQVVDVSKSAGMPYGYGWTISKQRGLKTIGHGGGLNGFLSHLVRFPDQNLTIVVLVNASAPPPGLNPGGISSRIAQYILWEEMDPAPTHTIDASVTAKDMAPLVGDYDYGSAVLTVTQDGRRLFAQMSGQPKAEIFPRSKTEYFWKVVDAQVTFEFDDKNQVVRAIHQQNGAMIKAPRMKTRKVVTVEPKLLDAYVGKYDYGAKTVVLTVTREGKHLFAQLTGQPKFEIFPKSENEFFWKIVPAEVTFVKDDNGQVIKAVHRQAGKTINAPKLE